VKRAFPWVFFDEDYLQSGPLAIVRQGTTIVAFANLWQGGDVELSVDLMRFTPESPAG